MRLTIPFKTSHAPVLVLAMILVGCVGCVADYDQRDGAAISDAIRAANSPLIHDVRYNPGDYMDPATIYITLRAGATRAQARALICDIAMPAVRAGEPPDGLGVTAWDLATTQVVASDLDPCPSP